eukprot:RCo036838
MQDLPHAPMLPTPQLTSHPNTPSPSLSLYFPSLCKAVEWEGEKRKKRVLHQPSPILYDYVREPPSWSPAARSSGSGRHSQSLSRVRHSEEEGRVGRGGGPAAARPTLSGAVVGKALEVGPGLFFLPLRDGLAALEVLQVIPAQLRHPRWAHLAGLQLGPVHAVEEGQLGELRESQPLRGVLLQQCQQQYPRPLGEGARKLDRLVHDLLAEIPLVLGRKWQGPRHHVVARHSKAPPVHFLGVGLMAQDLRGHVGHGPAERLSLRAVHGQAKVGEGAVPLTVQEDVAQLEVPVHAPLAVEIP